MTHNDPGTIINLKIVRIKCTTAMTMFRSKKILWLWLTVLAVGLGLSVFTFVKMRPPSLPKQMQMAGRSVVSDGELSQIAQQYLQRQDLMKSFKTDPVGVIEKLKQPGPLSETADRVYTWLKPRWRMRSASSAKTPARLLTGFFLPRLRRTMRFFRMSPVFIPVLTHATNACVSSMVGRLPAGSAI